MTSAKTAAIERAIAAVSDDVTENRRYCSSVAAVLMTSSEPPLQTHSVAAVMMSSEPPLQTHSIAAVRDDVIETAATESFQFLFLYIRIAIFLTRYYED